MRETVNESSDPRPARSRATIVTAATEHFLEHGYVGSNVDRIADEAGVSKRTVYNLFETKERLFRAVVESTTDIAEGFARDLHEGPVGGRPLEVELRELALSHATAVLNPRVVRVRRLLIGEAARFPDLAGEYYRRAPALVMDAIRRRLERYAAHGSLALPDAALASEHFAFLVLGATLDRALFGAVATAPKAALEARAVAGAEAFLTLYGRSLGA